MESRPSSFFMVVDSRPAARVVRAVRRAYGIGLIAFLPIAIWITTSLIALIALLILRVLLGPGRPSDAFSFAAQEAIWTLLIGAIPLALIPSAGAMLCLSVQKRFGKVEVWLAVPVLVLSLFYFVLLNLYVPASEAVNGLLQPHIVGADAFRKLRTRVQDGSSGEYDFIGYMALWMMSFVSLALQFLLLFSVVAIPLSIAIAWFGRRKLLRVSQIKAVYSVWRKQRKALAAGRPRSRVRAMKNRAKSICLFVFGSFLLHCVIVFALHEAARIAFPQGAFDAKDLSPETRSAMSDLIERFGKAVTDREKMDLLFEGLTWASQASGMPVSSLVAAGAMFQLFVLLLPIAYILWFRNGWAMKCWLAANSYKRPTAEDALLADVRAPVVVLRSFSDDDVPVRADNPISRLVRPGVRIEEAFAPILRSLGPTVTIGQPAEQIPRIGADRSYVPGDKWQNAIMRWIDMSQLIVVVLGRGEGLRWELEQIDARNAWSKTVVLLPSFDDRKSRDLWRHLLDSFPRLGPSALENLPSGAAFVHVDDSLAWAVRSRRRQVSDWEAATILLAQIWSDNAPRADASNTLTRSAQV